MVATKVKLHVKDKARSSSQHAIGKQSLGNKTVTKESVLLAQEDIAHRTRRNITSEISDINVDNNLEANEANHGETTEEVFNASPSELLNSQYTLSSEPVDVTSYRAHVDARTLLVTFLRQHTPQSDSHFIKIVSSIYGQDSLSHIEAVYRNSYSQWTLIVRDIQHVKDFFFDMNFQGKKAARVTTINTVMVTVECPESVHMDTLYHELSQYGKVLSLSHKYHHEFNHIKTNKRLAMIETTISTLPTDITINGNTFPLFYKGVAAKKRQQQQTTSTGTRKPKHDNTRTTSKNVSPRDLQTYEKSQTGKVETTSTEIASNSQTDFPSVHEIYDTSSNTRQSSKVPFCVDTHINTVNANSPVKYNAVEQYALDIYEESKRRYGSFTETFSNVKKATVQSMLKCYQFAFDDTQESHIRFSSPQFYELILNEHYANTTYFRKHMTCEDRIFNLSEEASRELSIIYIALNNYVTYRTRNKETFPLEYIAHNRYAISMHQFEFEEDENT